MAIYTVKQNQNIFDIALNLYGSIEGVFDLLISNEWLSFDSDLKKGMELSYHEYYAINKGVANLIELKKYTAANGERNVYPKNVNYPIMWLCDVPADCLETSFIVSGNGNMEIDWGDNSPISKITLTKDKETLLHYFDNTIEEKRRIKVYGDFKLSYLNTSYLDGDLQLIRPITVDEYVNNSNKNNLAGLFLFKDTYGVNLNNSFISDLSPLYDFSLQYIDMSNATFSSVDVIDDYLEYISLNYGKRRPCRVTIDIEPTERGMKAINTIINEPEWNVSGKWEFIINETVYVGK